MLKVRLTESELKILIKKIINEVEFSEKTDHISEKEWENIWYKLRKINKTFSFPEYGNFNFGGLFFYYNDGVLEIGDQKLSDWASDLERARDIFDRYASRLRAIFEESNLGLELKVTPTNNFIIKKIKKDNDFGLKMGSFSR